MKRTVFISVLLLLSKCLFAQLDGVDVNGIVNNPNNYLEKERQDIENTLKSEVEAHNKKQKSQQTQQQIIDNYNNMISNDGQRRMEYNNNPQNYINRDLTNRNSAQKLYNKPQEQRNDMRLEPIHSDNLNSKSLQYLREANREDFSDNHDIGMGGDAKVILFDAPTLDGYYGEFNEDNVRRYLNASESLAEYFIANPNDLNSILFDEYARVSGFSIDDIINKMSNERTLDETQALADFQEYRIIMMERIADEIDVIIDNSIEKKEIDAAILAFDVYGTDEEGYINNTNYKIIDLKELLDSKESCKNPIYNLANSINACNMMHDGTGIHVELYYNDVTNTYVISCAGSDDPYDDWVLNNAANALEGDVPQYMMAKTIGDAIKQIPQAEREKLKIEVVGHSLGGGMASIIGLTTGIETKTYNAARVPENFLKDNGLYDKVNNGEVQNIIAYHTSTDILTNTQNAIGTPAIGISVDIGDPATAYEKTKSMVAGGVVGTVVGNPAGAFVGEMVEGHLMGPMVRSIYNDKMAVKKFEWDYMRSAQMNLRNTVRR